MCPSPLRQKKTKKKGRCNLNTRKPGKSDIRIRIVGLTFQTNRICHKNESKLKQ